MAGIRDQAGDSLRAFRDVFRNPGLRRVELAFAGSELGDWGWTIALAVYAYGAGGTAAVGVLGLIKTLPAAVAAPFASFFADRFRRERVMFATDIARAAALVGATVAVVTHAPAGVIYGIAGFVYLAATAFRPAQAALLPSLAATPEELTAANVASSTIESVARFGGPALGGLLLAATSTRVVFAATVATFLWSALLVFGIRPPAAERETLPVQAALRDELLAGFRAIWTERRLRLLVSLFAAQTLVGGALNVLVVVVALRLLDLGNGGVGYLFSAVGIGGVLGAAAAVALIGRRRLAAAFGVGVVFWGTPIALVAVFPHTAAALILFAVIGLANTIVDVAGLTLLQRSVPGEVLGRVFGVLESIILATVALGAILAPVLVSGLGIRGALVAAGVFLPIVVALTWRPLAAMDADASPPAQELDLVRNLPLFAPLPGPVLEHLAASLVPVAAPAGTTVVRQGDSGDRFYVVAGGRLAVSVDGVPAGTLEQGDHFGEIALLRDVPRSATVTAEADAELLALERDEFIAAVTGHAASAEAADAVIATRLGSLRPSVASL